MLAFVSVVVVELKLQSDDMLMVKLSTINLDHQNGKLQAHAHTHTHTHTHKLTRVQTHKITLTTTH